MKNLLCGVSLLALTATASLAGPAGDFIPTGQHITPMAAPGAVFSKLNPHVASSPDYKVGQAQTSLVSPDGKTMLVLTSGFNLNADPVTGAVDPATSAEFVFVFDISANTPVQKQAIPVPNTFSGIAWAPDGSAFFVGGGQDDNIHFYSQTGGVWAENGTPAVLNNTAYGVPQKSGLGLFSLLGLGSSLSPLTGGIAVTADGATLAVANMENDTLSLIDIATRTKIADVQLRPGKINAAQTGVPGGEFPYWIAIKGNGTAYVSSLRDREIDVISLSGATSTVTARIKVKGNPNRMVLNKAQTRLYVTADNADFLHVIDTAKNKVLSSTLTTAPAGLITGTANGAGPNSVTLSPDESTAYVTNAALNAVAVISLTGAAPAVTGLIPTGWQPNSVSVSADGSQLYVVNAKSHTGPNPLYPTGTANQYDWQLTKAGFLTLPVPSAGDLPALTAQVAANDGFNLKLSPADISTMSFLHNAIQHVVYIVKENRTYDQILGDLPVGNGDPSITMYGAALTPNFHAIATNFVDLDQYYDSGICSMDGWQYSTSGRGRDLNEKVVSVNYGKGGGSYDSEGTSRGVDVGYATGLERLAVNPLYGAEAIYDPDLLPGAVNAVAPDGPNGELGYGFIWNAAMRAKLHFRNYGFLLDLTRYNAPPELGGVAVLTNPYQTKTVVAFPAEASLVTKTDPYFRGFDNNLPDFYRYQEWAREFDGQVKASNFPNFETVRFMNDHTGAFTTAIDGVNTAETQQADNDYAVGLLIDKIAHSPYAANTLIFVTEDDSQDGPDHLDAHRSTGYVIGPYVKHGAVVSTKYTTVAMLRTMGDILGLEKLSVQVAGVKPMTDVFDTTQASWTFSAVPAQILLTNTTLPILNKSVVKHASLDAKYHDAAWWGEKTKGFSFAKEDQNDEAAYNRVLWEGAMGSKPYPTTRSGLDLSKK